VEEDITQTMSALAGSGGAEEEEKEKKIIYLTLLNK
jgi:hypothetical protein